MKIFDNPDIHDGESLNAFYKKLLDQVPDLIFKIRWDSNTEKYFIVFINESINDLYEVPHDLFGVNPRKVFYDRMVRRRYTAIYR